jgi:hypothetical protein
MRPLAHERLKGVIESQLCGKRHLARSVFRSDRGKGKLLALLFWKLRRLSEETLRASFAIRFGEEGLVVDVTTNGA